jgi:hypothetical protein
MLHCRHDYEDCSECAIQLLVVYQVRHRYVSVQFGRKRRLGLYDCVWPPRFWERTIPLQMCAVRHGPRQAVHPDWCASRQ